MSYPIPKPSAPLKKNVLDILKTKTVKILAHESSDKNQELVPSQIIELKQQADELNLLRHQVMNNGNVNDFLIRKYTDGGPIGTAKEARYDNSKERIEAGISYEYHVYYPMNEQDNFKLANHRYIITPKLIDHKTGDHYYYHFPIREFIFNNQFFYKIDYLEELVTTGGIPAAPSGYYYNNDRLFFALGVLSQRITNQDPRLEASIMSTLVDHGFITMPGGKLHLDVQLDRVVVEKYFLKLNQDKKTVAMEYLTEEFGPSDPPPQPVADATPSPQPAILDDYEKKLQEDSIKFSNYAHHSQFKPTSRSVELGRGMSLDEMISAWKINGVPFYSVKQKGGRTHGPIYLTFGRSVAAIYLKPAFGLATAVLDKAVEESRSHMKSNPIHISTVIRIPAITKQLRELGLDALMKKGSTPDNIFETMKFPNFTIEKI
jgi:hypothetical protein